MKRIIGLLTMLFVMAACASGQVVNNKCSDGSTPAKAVSPDGSYYVYICAGDVSNSTLLPNTLKQIKVVKNWEPVVNYNSMKSYVNNTYTARYQSTYNNNGSQWCINRLKTVEPYPGKAPANNLGGDTATESWAACTYHLQTVLGSKDPMQIGKILLYWASSPVDPLTVIYNPKINVQTAGYQLPSALGTFSQFYAIFYNEMTYSSAERKLVDDYLTRKLMEQKFPVLGRDYRGPNKKCNINDINSVLKTRTGTNNCGNIRTKVSMGEIMLGFRLENQKLLDKGHDDLYIVYAFINKDGININSASRGAATVNYVWDYAKMFVILAEIYKSVGYDFYEHTLPHGAKVKDVMAFHYKLIHDYTLTAKWAKNNVGTLSRPYKRIKGMTQQQFEQTNDYGESYAYEHGDNEFVKTHVEYVKRYMPELWKKYSETSVRNYQGSRHIAGTNSGVSPYWLYVGNNAPIKAKVVEPIVKVMDYSLNQVTGNDWRKHYKHVSSN